MMIICAAAVVAHAKTKFSINPSTINYGKGVWSVDSIRKPQPSFKRGKAESAHTHLTWCNGMMRGFL